MEVTIWIGVIELWFMYWYDVIWLIEEGRICFDNYDTLVTQSIIA